MGWSLRPGRVRSVSVYRWLCLVVRVLIEDWSTGSVLTDWLLEIRVWVKTFRPDRRRPLVPRRALLLRCVDYIHMLNTGWAFILRRTVS